MAQQQYRGLIRIGGGATTRHRSLSNHRLATFRLAHALRCHELTWKHVGASADEPVAARLFSWSAKESIHELGVVALRARGGLSRLTWALLEKYDSSSARAAASPSRAASAGTLPTESQAVTINMLRRTDPYRNRPSSSSNSSSWLSCFRRHHHHICQRCFQHLIIITIIVILTCIIKDL